MTAHSHPAITPHAERRIAHEFANLMQVVNGNLELLSLRTTDPDARRYLANARSAAEQLTELSHQLSAAERAGR